MKPPGLGVALLAAVLVASAAEKRALVYTRNFVTSGTGYVHDNIQSSVDAIKKMGAGKGFSVDASDDPKVFTGANLKQYSALAFSNSNNEAFEDDSQRDAFRTYIQAGGAFVGIHSASGSERNWPYFWSVLGGRFLRHPRFQKLVVRVKDADHPATKETPFRWPGIRSSTEAGSSTPRWVTKKRITRIRFSTSTSWAESSGAYA